MRAALLILVAATGACGSSAPKGVTGRPDFVVEGKVQDESGNPLSHAGVVLEGSPLGGLTDRDGEFRLAGVSPPTYRLAVIYLGYRSRSVSLSVSRDPLEVSLPMERDPALGTAYADTMAAIMLHYTLRVGSGP